ncbi:MAG: putative sulfate exporter family transporter [Ardenticatenaceae bacterium]|nr:putative sulfate exporter family transporter [Ardenticatenaceae bacterium]
MATTTLRSRSILPSWWSRFFPAVGEIQEAVPGFLAVVLPITLVAEGLWVLELQAGVSWFVAIFIASVLGLIVGNLWAIPARYQPGLAFSTKWFLRLGIIIAGLKFNYSFLFESGWQQATIVLIAVATGMGVSWYAGKALGLSERTRTLIGVGTSICGVSAIMATAPAIQAQEEESGIALGTVLLWGTIGLLVYPFLAGLFHLAPTIYGAWTGGSIHDLPQIVAAAVQGGGPPALESALFVKMLRMAFIIVLVVSEILFFAMRRKTARPGQNVNTWAYVLRNFPLFVILFFVVVVLNTVAPPPASVAGPLATWKPSTFPMTVADILLIFAVVGITCRVTRSAIARAGVAALLTGLVTWVVQSALILALALLFFA